MQALLDRLVLVDSESKSAALFNYEEAHLFGLRSVYVIHVCLSLCYMSMSVNDDNYV